jgi:non-specific protein-tyrosine kinase
VGFTSVLLGEATLDEALQPISGFNSLKILASGKIPPNPSELLSGASAREVFSRLAADSDIILIDSPPVLPVTDAAVLAGRVDAVVLVSAVGISSRNQLTRSLEVLGRVDAPLSGIVLNRVSETDAYSYYRYAYGTPISQTRSRRNGKAKHAVSISQGIDAE